MAEQPAWAERPWEKPPEGEGAAAAKKSGGKGCLISAALLVFGVVSCSVAASMGGGDSRGGASLAEVVCERAVKEAMLDPGSARFSNVVSVSTGTDKYRVTGTVRGTNALGGVALQTFTCAADESSGTMRVSARFD